MKITICASAAFYRDVVTIATDLETKGFDVVIPITATKMRANDDYDVSRYKTWYKDPNDYSIKAELMRDHFNKVVSADAILVVNQTKHDVQGYVGGNVLMEMALAFHFKKKIYILNGLPKNSPLEEELLGLKPIILNGDLSKISVA